eukprot:gnl/MRDRNA2_/MRDRNA2_196501_c0_seq1.p1 gnl/MRDRNA2_/MRDRNA2_196501_c0~~gnl/MRDRNA2_/MRDRNA2_196501_c0_seq1.p1  ORF type:complete len:163 (+),score=35.33 gnl/MRDRNA2_/MRDRNA2_196501_c0_seq1:85-573(+)
MAFGVLCCKEAQDVMTQEIDETQNAKGVNPHDEEHLPGCQDQNLSHITPIPKDEEDTLTQGNEFWVVLNKSGGDVLGISVSYLDGETLLVDSIDEGLVKTWNDAHTPGYKIHVCDHLIEINGKSGSAADLLEECSKSDELKIKVWSRKRASSVNLGGPASGA